MCVRLTTNGVVVRHQVLSPGWGSNTCQLKFGWERTVRLHHGRKVQQRKVCARVSIDPALKAGPVLYSVTDAAGSLP